MKTTAMLLAYNQEHYVREAIASLVSQTVQPDEILISDDCSTDSTFTVLRDEVAKIRASGRYNGIINLNRNQSNIGFICHFNWAVQASGGDLILYNAGDDVSLPSRLEVMHQLYRSVKSEKYFLGHSPVVVNGGDQHGQVWVPPIMHGNFSIERLANSCALHIGASQCFTKALFLEFGPILFGDAYEDLVLGYRALLTNSYAYTSKPLLKYRVGGLTFWQKNTWEVKRERYKAVLSQRALDSLRVGRLDLLNEVALSYQDYGFSGATHPECITVYCCENAERSDWSYSIVDHFHRFPHAIKIKSLDEYPRTDPMLSEGSEVYLHSMAIIEVEAVGWGRAIGYLERLRGQGMPVVIDCGITGNSTSALIGSTQVVSRIQELIAGDKMIQLTSACDLIALELQRLFGPRVISSPLLLDIDGFTRPVRRIQKCGGTRVLVRYTGLLETITKNSDLLDRSTSAIKSLYGSDPQVWYAQGNFIEQVKECTFDTNGTRVILEESNNCLESGLENFDHIVFFNLDSRKECGLEKMLRWRAITSSIPHTVVSHSTLSQVYKPEHFELARADLYFNYSVQKRLRVLLEWLEKAIQVPAILPRYHPL